MKHSLILIVLFLMLVSTVNSKTEELHCDTITEISGLCFDVEFSVTTDKELKIPAKYNFPYFIRAGDYLYIKKIKVFNLDNSTRLKPGQFILDIKPIDYLDLPYTDLKKIYPTNYGTFYFDIGALKPGFSCEIAFNFEEKIYTSNCGEDFTVGRLYVDLFKEGEWVIVDQYIPDNRSESYGHTSIFNGRWRGNTFKVTSGFEMDNLKDLKTSSIIILISLFVTIAFTLLSLYLQLKGLTQKEETYIKKEVVFIVYLIIIIAIIAYFVLSKFI